MLISIVKDLCCFSPLLVSCFPPPVGIAYCEYCVKRPSLGQGYWQECSMTDGNVKFIQCEPERQIGKRIEGINLG